MSARSLAIVAVALMLFVAPAFARNGAFRLTGHGDSERGPARRTDIPRGSCAQCHMQHSSYDPGTSRNTKALFAPNDNDLCFACHTTSGADGTFGTRNEWLRSAHATSTAMLLPDRERTSEDVNKCVNCHDPHGNRDAQGVIPALLRERETTLCLICHDGSRAPDIANELRKAYVHPVGARAAHQPAEAVDETLFRNATPASRHAGCSDCHNAHIAGGDPAPPSPPQASNRLAGVSRVEVVNGGAGALPTYRFLAAGEPGEVLEYEICFKCHSSFTKQPARQSDLARLTNPNNASFHPIQAEGRNRNIDPAAFAGSWTSQSLVRCTDCHGTDDARVLGPHGSSNAFLLQKPYTTADTERAAQRDELCFTCHAWSVYGDAAAPEALARASRFNAPSAGHTFHAGVQVSCDACHEPHGSIRNPALIRSGGRITFYTQSVAGGTCATSCHASKSYAVSYPR